MKLFVLTITLQEIKKMFVDNHFFELVCHDITDPYYAEVDEIYNMACPASPVITNTIPLRPLRLQ